MIKIVIAGFKGRMGTDAVKMVMEHENFDLVGCYDPHFTGKNINELSDFRNWDVPVFQDKKVMIDAVKPAIWIDFTVPAVAYENTAFAIENGIAPVVGTTGITNEQVVQLQTISQAKNVGGLIAPNFAIGAVLMMQFAVQAAKYFPDVEIIEMHHDQKLDAPSGTAIKTAEMIAQVRQPKQQGNPDEKETLVGARGAEYDGMRIHSVRLPGLIAHQQVQFGGVGEGLTIRHDSYDRKSFMTGVALACEKVLDLPQLVYGLEEIL